MLNGNPKLASYVARLEHSVPQNRIWQWILENSPWNPAPFGVALFFLISGFVIPYSVNKLDRVPFAIARTFRILPTYALSLVLTLLSMWMVHWYLGEPFQIPWVDALGHVLMVRDLWFVPSIDGIVWTLEVETKFYLVCCLILPIIRAGDLTGIASLHVLFTLGMIWVGRIPIELSSSNLRWFALLTSLYSNASYFNFLWMGTAFSFLLQGKVSAAKALFYIVVFDCLFWIQVLGFDTVPRVVVYSYHSAILVFAVGYWMRNRFPRYSWLDRLGDISYPLYTLHACSGYCWIILGYHVGMPLWISTLLFIGLLVPTAYFVHWAVEVPSQRMGKSFAKYLDERMRKPFDGSLRLPRHEDMTIGRLTRPR